jgi:hypothetical protein
MTVTYNDPYKTDFARIKGDKRGTYFKLVFDEAKLYKHENSYVLAGHFIALGNVPHHFASKTIELNLCEIAIYSSEYEVRQKIGDTKEYEAIKLQPSINELMLHAHIESNASAYMQDGKALRGEIAFYPDDNFIVMANDEDRKNYVLNFTKLEIIDATGKYPDWTPPKAYRGNGNGYAAKGITPDDKLAFLKKELSLTIFDPSYREKLDTLPLSAYVEKVIMENRGKEDFLGAYFSLLGGVVS